MKCTSRTFPARVEASWRDEPDATEARVHADGELNDAQWLDVRCSGPARPGSVAFHAPTAVWQAPGGGETQLIRTARALEDLGVRARPWVAWRDRLDPQVFRCLHLFGLSREGLELARIARVRGVKLAVSPICWYEPRSLWKLSPHPLAGFQAVTAWVWRRSGAARLTRSCWRTELLNLADIVLPNSQLEAEQLRLVFGVDSQRLVPVPNGIEPRRFTQADPELFRRQVGWESYVLYAGRIEPRKNPLGLIRALSRCEAKRLPLVILGSVVPGHENYANQVARAIDQRGAERTRWLQGITHDDPLLASAMAAARVVALPSWFETPGLAALEGAAAGAAVVVTPYGSTREIFGNWVRYARPEDREGLAREVTAAWLEGAPVGLAEWVTSRYAWSETARLTREAYDRITA